MKKKTTIRRVLSISLVTAATIAGGFLLQHSPILSTAVQIWRGYYTLIVYENPRVSSALILDRLEETFSDLLSLHNAEEQITDFTGQESVNVKNISTRLDSLDPRLDPYLRNIGNWFAAEVDSVPADLFYVKTSSPPFPFIASLSLAFSGTSIRWNLVGLPRQNVILSLVLFLIIVTTEIGFYDGCTSRWWRFLLSIPWVFIVGNGGLIAALIAIPSYIVVAKFVAPIANNPCQSFPAREILVKMSFLFLFGFISVAVNMELFSTVTAHHLFLPFYFISRMGFYFSVGMAWSLLIACVGVIVHWVATASRQKHVLVQMIDDPSLRACDRPVVRISASLTMCLIGFFIVASVFSGQVVPRPIILPESRSFRLDSLPNISNPDTAHLPTLSDYVAHVAYQETLEYGRSYRLPIVGERVILNYYHHDLDGNLVEEKRQIVRFSDQWLESKLQSINSNSISSLLVAQGKPVIVQSMGPKLFADRETVIWIVFVLILSLAVTSRKYSSRQTPLKHKYVDLYICEA